MYQLLLNFYGSSLNFFFFIVIVFSFFLLFFTLYFLIEFLYKNLKIEKIYPYDRDGPNDKYIKNIYDKIIVYDSLPTEQEMEPVKNYINFQDLYEKYYEKKTI